jgi:hypothetical protein
VSVIENRATTLACGHLIDGSEARTGSLIARLALLDSIKRGIVRCPAPRHAWLAIMLEVPTLRKIQVFLQNVNQARTAPSKRSG